MKMIIREYLSMMRESEELDAVLSELLLSMDIHPISKPQRGVRQYGVDLAARGVDPNDNLEKMFLFVVKQKDIDRNSWDSGPQSVRPTLNEIFDVYFHIMIDNDERILPKKIVLCTNGDLKQEVLINWKNYIREKQIPGEVEFDFWGGDKLSTLIDTYMLDEFLFFEPARKYIRKTLAFIDLVDYDLSHYYKLIDEILFDDTLTSDNKKVKALRSLYLCLNLVFYWSNECNNLKHAFHAAERLVLRLWAWIKENELFENRKVFTEFYKIEGTRKQINKKYLEKIRPNCMVRDGLSGYGADEIEYPLRVFEQIGIVASIGLDYIFSNDIFNGEEENNYLMGEAQFAAEILKGIISNNKVSNWPVFDSHINDINLALLLLYRTKNKKFGLSWISSIFDLLAWGYQLRRRFPLFSDSYDDLVEIELNNDGIEPKSSTLLPLLTEWCIVLESVELYNKVRNIMVNVFEKINYQIWFPDSTTERYLYLTNALYESGSMLTSIQIPNEFNLYKDQLKKQSENEEEPNHFSFIINNYPIIGIIAFRYFRTPVFPFYFRKLTD